MALEAPLSEVDICNLALDLLKQKPIVELDPPTTQVEELCARWYQQKRRAVLRSHPWNFAMKRVTLTPVSNATPLFGYTHAYNLPNDFVRFVGRYEDIGDIRGQDLDYEIENGQLLFNGEDNASINVRYIFDQKIVSKFDPLFIEALSLELAIVMAPKFSGTEARVTTLIRTRAEVIGEARSIDGQERPPRRRQTSKWLNKRSAGYQTNTADRYTRFS